jgi:hypothetical protein
MKKNIKILTTTMLILGVLVTTVAVTLAKTNSTGKDSRANSVANSILTDNKSKVTKADTDSQNKTNEGKKIAEVNTTWGEFLDSYMKETKEYYNPRQDISKDHKVRVVKTEYANGIEMKNGFYSYGLITQILDEKTGELLNSIGEYKNNK